MSVFDAARAEGHIEPAENEGWLVESTVPDVSYGGSFGSVVRTGRGSLKPGQLITMLYRKHERGRTLVMSDTPDELRDLAPILYNGRGRILVNGLGLGCVLRGLLAKESVEHIDVVEISQELIDLIGPSFTDVPVTIHQGDAFEFKWPAGTRWDCAWHDVWDELCASNLNESSGYASPGSYERLHRRYGGRVGWQGSWGWDYLRRQVD